MKENNLKLDINSEAGFLSDKELEGIAGGSCDMRLKCCKCGAIISSYNLENGEDGLPIHRKCGGNVIFL